MNFLNAERRRHLSTAVVVIIIFLAGFALGNQYAVGNAQGDTSPPPDAQQAFEPFWQVYNLIQSDYIDEIDVEKLVDSATRGLVDALDDPYSGYMDAEL
jgi:carboxyl-terminal processing protease